MGNNKILCLDIGTKNIKAVLINCDTKKLNVPLHILTLNDFITYINRTYKELMISFISLQGILKDTETNLQIVEENNKYVYPEEILTQLFDRIKNETKHENVINIAVNLPDDKVTKCAAILSGLNVNYVPTEIAIAHLYITSIQRQIRNETRYLLSADLGYSSLKLYIIAISTCNYPSTEKTEIHEDWSCNEINIHLTNYLESKKISKTKCEEIIRTFTTNSKQDNLITLNEFELIIEYTVRRLCNKIKMFVRNYGNIVSDVILSGGGAKLPMVVEAIEDILNKKVYSARNVDVEDVIVTGIGKYLLDKK